MNKKILLLLIISFSAGINFNVCSESIAGPGAYTPEVYYISPKSEAIIDISNKKEIAFRWKPAPIPPGGRREYRFKLIKGYGYNFIVTKVIDPRVYTVSVPISEFEKGQTYTWQVQQRSNFQIGWNRDVFWSFEIKK